MDHDSFLNNLIEHSELYKNFTEKDLKKFSDFGYLFSAADSSEENYIFKKRL